MLWHKINLIFLMQEICLFHNQCKMTKLYSHLHIFWWNRNITRTQKSIHLDRTHVEIDTEIKNIHMSRCSARCCYMLEIFLHLEIISLERFSGLILSSRIDRKTIVASDEVDAKLHPLTCRKTMKVLEYGQFIVLLFFYDEEIIIVVLSGSINHLDAITGRAFTLVRNGYRWCPP